MEPVTFVPLALIAVFALAFPDELRHSRIARYAVAAALGVVFLRYLSWRLPVTVLPADKFDTQGVLVWTLFAIEILAWLDATILFSALCRRTDRSGEADMHEARLRAMATEWHRMAKEVLHATALEQKPVGDDGPPHRHREWTRFGKK